MNTLIHYQYRDGSNYKNSGTWIITGPVTQAQEQALLDACLQDDDQFFVPSAVGIPDIQPSWDDDIDHAFHTLGEFAPTDLPAQDARTIDELVASFAKRDWESDGANLAMARG